MLLVITKIKNYGTNSVCLCVCLCVCLGGRQLYNRLIVNGLWLHTQLEGLHHHYSICNKHALTSSSITL